MKINIINYYWGTSIDVITNKNKFVIYLNREYPKVEIIDGHSSPINPRILYSIPWDKFAIKNCFYTVNNGFQIKSMKRNTVKQYFKNIIIRLDKLGVFYRHY